MSLRQNPSSGLSIKDLPFAASSAQLHYPVRQRANLVHVCGMFGACLRGRVLQRAHGLDCVHACRLDVARLRDSHVRMPKYRLDHLVGHSETVKIGRETPAECMPAVPRQVRFLQCGTDDIVSGPGQ